MPLADLIYILDLLGTLVFAISGVVAAVERKFDLVGAFFIGLVTALGGGTTRDVLMGSTPVSWMLEPQYLLMVVIAMLLCYLFFRSLSKMRRSLFIFDSIGLGLFSILGFQKALIADLSIPIALILAIVSSVFGGVLRDVLTNQVPLIFRKEIYALAALAGALLYWLGTLVTLNPALNAAIAIAVVVAIRSLAVSRGWQSPFLPLGQKKD